jgi:hypothetical protein
MAIPRYDMQFSHAFALTLSRAFFHTLIVGQSTRSKSSDLRILAPFRGARVWAFCSLGGYNSRLIRKRLASVAQDNLGRTNELTPGYTKHATVHGKLFEVARSLSGQECEHVDIY